MNLNLYIIMDELNLPASALHGRPSHELNLRQICPLTEQDMENGFRPDPKDLYIAPIEVIKDYPSDFRNCSCMIIGKILPENMTDDIFILNISDQYSALDAFLTVQSIFRKYQDWEMEILKAISRKDPIPLIADLIASVLHEAFVVLDITASVIVIGGKKPEHYEGTIWELVLNDHNTRRIGDNIWSEMTYYLNQGEGSFYITAPVYRSNRYIYTVLKKEARPIGMMCMADINRSFTEGDLSLFTYAGKLMGWALACSDDITVSADYTIYYIEEMLKGFQVAENIIDYHLSLRGWSSEAAFRVFYLNDTNGKKFTEHRLAASEKMLREFYPDQIVFCYENALILIMKIKQKNAPEHFSSGALKKLSLHAGMSETFYSFYDLKTYYIQSKNAFTEGSVKDPNRLLWAFHDYYYDHLLHSLDQSTSLKSLCLPELLCLHRYDLKNGTDYMDCLNSFILSGLNIAKASQLLYMHRNTLVYKLQRISDIIGIPVQNLSPEERLHYLLSCRIIKSRSEEENESWES